MTWYPLAFLPPQIENTTGVPYSGAVLKAYAAGTNDNIPMATDYTGVTTAASMVLNAAGYVTQGGAIVIPHLQENYKLALYPSQAAADADSGAVWTVDQVQIAASTNSAFIQYFDGDGVTATFTLSQNFGVDENILMVFADRSLPNYVSNGDFATDTIWTKGAGWTIGAGVATAAGAISVAISQNANVPLVQGESYTVEFTVTASAGTLTPSVGGNAGTTRGVGTWRETIIAGATQVIAFTGVAFTGTLDAVSVKDVMVTRREINRPDEYTLVGNQLTLVNIPPTGTKNVIVFAPSLLLGAANNAAAAAATSEANALGYANTASAAATTATTQAGLAATAYDSFDDRYLGAKAVAPTLDNDGNALITGALYFDTVLGSMFIWTGSVWTAAFVTGTGFLATANNLSELTATQATARTNIGAAKSGVNSDITALSSLAVIPSIIQSGLLGGFKNKLINGDLRRWEYGTAYTTISTASYGAANRWFSQSSASTTEHFNRDTNPPIGFQYNAKMGRNVGGTNTSPIILGQVLESLNSYALAGKTVTLSYYAKKGANYSAASSLLTTALYTGTGLDQSSQNMINGAWTGQVQAINANDVLTTSWQRFEHSVTLGSTTTQVGMEFVMTPVGTAGADDNYYIAGVQLEIGSVASTFEDRGETIEDILCQRYLPSFTYLATAKITGWLGMCTGTTTAAMQLPWRVRPRVVPTAVSASAIAHFSVWNSSGVPQVATNLTFDTSSSVESGQLNVTVASGLSAGNATAMITQNSAAKLLFTGIEL